MSSDRSIIRADTTVTGDVTCHVLLEVFGTIDGDVKAGELVIHEQGRVLGTISARSLEVAGTSEGKVEVSDLLRVRGTGVVSGDVRYGRLAVEEGAQLNAQITNVPPKLEGDLTMSVMPGGAVQVTLDDLNAVDPDDAAGDLVFSVSNLSNGQVMTKDAPARPVTRFTQADLQRGAIVFKHDGSRSTVAGFDVVVADREGATSGAPQSVRVDIR